MQVNFLENNRSGFYLLHGGLEYSVRTRRNDRTYWRSVDRQCPATVVTVTNILVTFGRPHNHDGDFTGLEADSFVSGAKNRCWDEEAPISIHDEEFTSTAECGLWWFTFQSCKSGLYQSRGKMVPNLPITLQEVILLDPWTQTLARERYLLYDGSVDAGNCINFAILLKSDLYFRYAIA